MQTKKSNLCYEDLEEMVNINNNKVKKLELKKLIREEIRKILKEGKLEKSIYRHVNISDMTADDFIILDMILGTNAYDMIINLLKSQKVTSCTVKPGSLDSGYSGFNVVITLASGNEIKLFVDKDEFSGTSLLKALKSMTVKPDGKLLASAMEAANQ